MSMPPRADAKEAGNESESSALLRDRCAQGQLERVYTDARQGPQGQRGDSNLRHYQRRAAGAARLPQGARGDRGRDGGDRGLLEAGVLRTGRWLAGDTGPAVRPNLLRTASRRAARAALSRPTAKPRL